MAKRRMAVELDTRLHARLRIPETKSCYSLVKPKAQVDLPCTALDGNQVSRSMVLAQRQPDFSYLRLIFIKTFS